MTFRLRVATRSPIFLFILDETAFEREYSRILPCYFVGRLLRNTITGATEANSATMRKNDICGTEEPVAVTEPGGLGCTTDTVPLASLKQPTESKSRTSIE
jgi:hypothetical protein